MSFANKEQLEELASYMASKIKAPTIGVGGGYAPIGTIISYMGTTAPEDYLFCDGDTYNISDYKQLANFIEAQFGSKNYFGGDGTTTFAVPDLRGEFLRGTGTNSHTNQGNGASVGTHQNATEHPAFSVTREGDARYLTTSYSGNRDMHVQNPVTNTTYDTSAKNADSSNSAVNSHTWIPFLSSNTSIDYTWYTARPTNTSVMYCIKAVVAGDVYSTTERVVGTWIDGKPIYQKTVDCGAIPNNTTKSVAHGISDIDAIISMSGFAFNSYHNGIPLPCPENNSIYTVGIDKSGDYIRIMNAADRSSLTSSYITIRYTKTTD